jgi:hypothetical protein
MQPAIIKAQESQEQEQPQRSGWWQARSAAQAAEMQRKS